MFWFTFQRQLIAEKGSVQLLVQLHIKQYLRCIYFIVLMKPLLVDTIILPVPYSPAERCARLCCGQCRRPECGGPGRAAAAQRAV